MNENNGVEPARVADGLVIEAAFEYLEASSALEVDPLLLVSRSVINSTLDRIEDSEGQSIRNFLRGTKVGVIVAATAVVRLPLVVKMRSTEIKFRQQVIDSSTEKWPLPLLERDLGYYDQVDNVARSIVAKRDS